MEHTKTVYEKEKRLWWFFGRRLTEYGIECSCGWKVYGNGHAGNDKYFDEHVKTKNISEIR